MKKILAILSLAVLTVGLPYSCSKDADERIDKNEAEIAKLEAAIGQYTQLKSDITSVISALTAEVGTRPADEQGTVWSCIASLESQCSTFDAAIKALDPSGVDKKISELVSTYRLEGLAASVQALKDVVDGKGDTPSLVTQIARLKEKVDAVADILDRIEALEELIQSIVFVPEYQGGAAVARITGGLVFDNLSLDFRVRPASAVDTIIKYSGAVSLDYKPVKELTKSESALNSLAIEKIEKKEGENDIVSVIVKGGTLDALTDAILEKDKGIAVCLRIKAGGNDVLSGFVDLDVDCSECYVEYGDVKYRVAYLGGRWWFMENLRYVPAGYTPCSVYTESSNDKAKCIFYPAIPVSDDGTKFTGLTPAATASTFKPYSTSVYVDENGLLYNAWAFLLDENFNSATADTARMRSYNGCQGICPAGWHIPSDEDMMATFGSRSVKSTFWEPALNPEDNSSAPLFDNMAGYSNICYVNRLGFDFRQVGAVTAESTTPYTTNMAQAKNVRSELAGKFGLNYMATSTVSAFVAGDPSRTRLYGLMSTVNATFQYGKLAEAVCKPNYAISVRCVKDVAE